MRKTKVITLLLFAAVCLAALLGLGGCAGQQKVNQTLPAQIPPTQPMVEPPPALSEGSLWQTNSGFNSFFIDTKARKVGDIVTVKIDESASAINKANTKTGRNSSLEAGIEKFFGLEEAYQVKEFNPFSATAVKGNLKSEFDGSGTTSRSGELSAFITCRVTEVQRNGNLTIVGTRELMVNDETQLIILSGIIRPRDISDENVILSTFISNAKIVYSGSGVVNDRQRPGWLANALNKVWPF